MSYTKGKWRCYGVNIFTIVNSVKSENDTPICQLYNKADAEHICQCVNGWDKLVKERDELIKQRDKLLEACTQCTKEQFQKQIAGEATEKEKI